MIATGRQIAAARALLGWSQGQLARAAGLHANAVAYWERHETIETYRPPFACERIRDALQDAGVETFLKPAPGVRFAEISPRASPDRRRRNDESHAHGLAIF